MCVACSNILTAVDGDYGVEPTWREGVNSNAYYFVSVVAERGPAEIVFNASQAGNLGSPIVVAAGGETNLVPLLVGVEYAVTSSVPISVSAPADGFAQVVVDSPSTCRIHWPINFIFTETVGEAMRSGNVTRTYEVTASPFDPGGVFAWNQPGGCWPSGSVGEATLRTVNYIGPMHVSFQGVAVSEVPCYDVIPATGCFTQGVHNLSHTVEAQAGRAYRIKPGNYWCIDNAESAAPETNWVQGVASEMIWKIPIGWHRVEAWATQLDYWPTLDPDYMVYGDTNSVPLLIGGRGDMYLQERHIDGNGVYRTDKFGHWISRSRWCHIILDGRTVQWFH